MKPPELELSADQIEALHAFTALVEERALSLGLVSKRDHGRVFERHVLDSVRAAALFGPGDHAAVDIGSGAGLPGIPLAIAIPACGFVLVEPKARRAGFLELCRERLGLENVRVVRARVEEVDERFDVATARAFAGLAAAWEAGRRLLLRGGRLIYFAGAAIGDPAATLRSGSVEPPARVVVDPVLETATPLVIMVRG